MLNSLKSLLDSLIKGLSYGFLHGRLLFIVTKAGPERRPDFIKHLLKLILVLGHHDDDFYYTSFDSLHFRSIHVPLIILVILTNIGHLTMGRLKSSMYNLRLFSEVFEYLGRVKLSLEPTDFIE